MTRETVHERANKFWIVWCPETRYTSEPFDTFNKAFHEAEAMAIGIGYKYYVLSASRAVSYQKVEKTTHVFYDNGTADETKEEARKLYDAWMGGYKLGGEK